MSNDVLIQIIAVIIVLIALFIAVISLFRKAVEKVSIHYLIGERDVFKSSLLTSEEILFGGSDG